MWFVVNIILVIFIEKFDSSQNWLVRLAQLINDFNQLCAKQILLAARSELLEFDNASAYSDKPLQVWEFEEDDIALRFCESISQISGVIALCR